jgi:hypothetical protein
MLKTHKVRNRKGGNGRTFSVPADLNTLNRSIDNYLGTPKTPEQLGFRKKVENVQT